MARTPSQLSPDELDKLYIEWVNGSTPLTMLASQLEVNAESLRSHLGVHGVNRPSRPVPEVKEEWTDHEYALQRQHDRELTQAKAQSNHFRRLYLEATKKDSAQDVLIETLRDSIVAWPTPNLELFKVTHSKAHGVHTKVCMISDLHVGEVVDPEAMMGMGAYNLDIFRQRAGLYVKNFLRLLDIERSGREIPRLTLFLDGDFISGLIHDELLKTNAVNVMDQMTLAATVMAWVVREIGRYFEEVHVSCTVGNHGRNTQKVEFKEPSLSWDYMCYQMMAFLLKNDDHITWDISKSLWAVTKVENLDLLHYHGHGRVQNTLSIPYYGIEKAVREMREIFQVHDLTFDGLLMGHYHHFFERDLGTGPIIINPCWKGGDEFALGIRKYSKPAQTVFLVHNKRGYIGSQQVHLWGQTEEDAAGVPQGPAHVWADSVI